MWRKGWGRKRFSCPTAKFIPNGREEMSETMEGREKNVEPSSHRSKGERRGNNWIVGRHKRLVTRSTLLILSVPSDSKKEKRCLKAQLWLKSITNASNLSIPFLLLSSSESEHGATLLLHPFSFPPCEPWDRRKKTVARHDPTIMMDWQKRLQQLISFTHFSLSFQWEKEAGEGRETSVWGPTGQTGSAKALIRALAVGWSKAITNRQAEQMSVCCHGFFFHDSVTQTRGSGYESRDSCLWLIGYPDYRSVLSIIETGDRFSHQTVYSPQMVLTATCPELKERRWIIAQLIDPSLNAWPFVTLWLLRCVLFFVCWFFYFSGWGSVVHRSQDSHFPVWTIEERKKRGMTAWGHPTCVSSVRQQQANSCALVSLSYSIVWRSSTLPADHRNTLQFQDIIISLLSFQVSSLIVALSHCWNTSLFKKSNSEKHPHPQHSLTLTHIYCCLTSRVVDSKFILSHYLLSRPSEGTNSWFHTTTSSSFW